MIKLHTIKIENFRSIIEPIIISFPDKGIIRFRGKNGSGKTSVLEALYFSFFGESLKDGGTIQSSLTVEPAKVTLLFSVGTTEYRIERSPKKVGLWELVDGNYQPKGLYKNDTNALILELLGMTPMQFQNAIVMASANRRLGDYNEKERREFFKSLFDLDWVDKLRDKVQADYQRIKTDVDKDSIALSHRISALESAKANLANYSKFQSEADSEQAAKVNIALELLTSAQLIVTQTPEPIIPSHTDTTALQTSIKESENTAIEYMTELARISTRISHIRAQPVRKPSVIADSCKACGRDYDKESLEVAHEQYNRELEEAIALEAEKNKLIEELEITKAAQLALHKAATSLTGELRLQLSELEITNKQAKLDYDKALRAFTEAHDNANRAAMAYENAKVSSPKDYSEYIRKSKSDIAACNEVIEGLERNLLSLREELQAAEFWYKDALSPNGIKAHITKALFTKLNIALDRYSKLFGMAVRFTIDAEATYTKTELIVARADGVIIPYGDLSQGQVTRVQLTLQLGLYDLIAGGRWSLMLIDEPFLGLDADACESIMELLPLLAKDRAIFVIDQQLAEFPNTRTYSFELVNRQTYMQ